MSRTDGNDFPTADGGARNVDVIADLVERLSPVRPMRLGRLICACVAVQLAVAGGAAWWVGLRPDISSRVTEPGFLVLSAALVLAGIASSVAAVRAGIPGREPRPVTVLRLYAFPLLLATGVLLLAPHRSAWGGWHQMLVGCWSCIGVTLFAAATPWVVAVAVLSRLAPLWQVRAGVLVGLSALFLGALVTELHCPSSNAYHVAFAHYLPIAALSAVGCFLAVLVFRHRSVSR